MFSLIYILDVFFFVCLFWKIKIIIIKPYRASYFSSKWWEVLKSLKKKNIYFILFDYLVYFLNMTTLWTSCSLYETQFHSLPFHPINPIPSHPIPFYSIFTFLFYSFLFYSCLVYSLIGKNHYCPTKHLKVTKNSYAD